MVFRRQGTYAIASVLVAAVVAGLLFAGSALSQDKSSESKKDGKDSKQEKRVKNSETRTQKTKPPTKKTATQTADSLAARLAPQDPSVREALENSAQAEASADLNNSTATGRTTNGDSNIDIIDITNANDCNVQLGDSITFEVTGGPAGVTLATVTNGVNASIDRSGSTLVVTTSDPSIANGNIRFSTNATSGNKDRLLPTSVGLSVETSSIDCGDNNNGNGNNRPPRFFPPFFDDPNDFFNDDEDLDEDEDGDEDSSINSTTEEDCIDTSTDTDNDTNTDNNLNSNNFEDSSTSEESSSSDESASLERIDFENVAFQSSNGDNDTDDDGDTGDDDDQYNDDTDTETNSLDECDDEDDSPVSATSGDGGAEASTPGAVARSGDPDDLEPVTEPPDDVVDEIPTTGELPNTPGRLWAYVIPSMACLVPLALLVKRIRSCS
jgi:hypothetical protein